MIYLVGIVLTFTVSAFILKYVYFPYIDESGYPFDINEKALWLVGITMLSIGWLYILLFIVLITLALFVCLLLEKLYKTLAKLF